MEYMAAGDSIIIQADADTITYYSPSMQHMAIVDAEDGIAIEARIKVRDEAHAREIVARLLDATPLTGVNI